MSAPWPARLQDPSYLSPHAASAVFLDGIRGSRVQHRILNSIGPSKVLETLPRAPWAEAGEALPGTARHSRKIEIVYTQKEHNQ